MTDDLFRIEVAQLRERILLPRRSARLEFSSMPTKHTAALVTRRRMLASAGLGQRTKRLTRSLTMLSQRAIFWWHLVPMLKEQRQHPP